MRLGLFQASILLITFALSACTKQKTPELVSTTWTRQERTLAEQCSEVRLELGLLQRDNVLAIFRCQNWQAQFPELYAAIKKIPLKSWNHIFLPLQYYFYNDHQKRDEYLGLILEIDQKKALDDLSKVMASLMRSNFYDTLWRVFQTADTSPDASISKNEIKNFLKLLNVKPQIIANWMRVISVLNKSFKTHLEAFRSRFQHSKKKPTFELLRVQLLDQFFQEVAKKQFAQEEKDLTIKILTKQSKEQAEIPTPWLYTWYLDYTYPQLRNFLNISANDYPLFLSQLKNVLEALPEISCLPQNSSHILLINLEEELQLLLKELTLQTPFNFFQNILNASTEWLLSQSACQIRSNGGPLKIEEFFKALTEMLTDTDHYDLARFAQTLSTDIIPHDPFKISKFLSSNFFVDLNQFLKLLLEDTGEKSLLSPVFQIGKEIDPLTYFSAANLVQYYFDADHLDILKGLGKFWNVLKFEEKQFLLNIFDTHFKPGIDTQIILQLYMKMVSEAKQLVPFLASSWTSHVDQLDATFKSLKHFSQHFKGEAVLEEMRNFYSREQILEVLRVIGNLTAPPHSDVLSTFRISPFPGSIYTQDFGYRHLRSRPEPQLKNMSRCVSLILDSETIIPYLQSKKNQCQGFSIRGFALYFLDGVKDWLNRYQSTYDNDRNILSSTGLFSADFIFSQLDNLIQFNDLDFDLGHSDSQIKNLLNLGKNFLFDWPRVEDTSRGYLDEVDKLTTLLHLFLNSNSTPPYQLATSLLRPITQWTDDDLRTSLIEFGQHFISYGQYQEEKLEQGTELACKTTLQNQFGIDPCQKSSEIKPKLHKLLSGLIKKNVDSPTLLESLIDWFIPHVGIQIPFEKPTKRVPFQFKAAVTFFWDFFNSKNSKDIPYRDPIHEPEGDLEPPIKTARLIEQLGIVVRDVRFDVGKLGGHFLNSLSKSDDIPDTLDTKKRRLKLCISRLTPQCGGSTNRRLAMNALDAFTGLEALAADYPHTFGPNMNYSDFAQATFTTLVQSSSQKAQASDRNGFLPRQRYMPEHNYHFLLNLMDLAAFTNISRFVHSRFGTQEKDFFENLNTYEFERIQRNMFQGLIPHRVAFHLKNFIRNGIKEPEQRLFKRIDRLVDWLEQLNFEQSRMAEAGLKNILVLFTYLGNERIQNCELGCDPILVSDQFKKISPQIFLEHLETLLSLWESLDRAYQLNQKSFAQTLPIIFNLSQYLVWGLNKNRPAEQRLMIWKWLNHFFKWVVKEWLTPRETGEIGLTEIIAIINDHPIEFSQGVTSLQTWLNRLHFDFHNSTQEETKESFIRLGHNLKKLALAKSFDFQSFLNYVRFNLDKQSKHYMELPKIIASLGQKDAHSGRSKFYELLREIFSDRYSELEDWIDKLLSKIRIFDPSNSPP